MARKISSMSEATEIKSGDISIIVQDGETKKFNLDLLPSKAQIDEYKTDVENQLADYEQEITDIKNQYDKELYTPEISVTGTSIVKTGQGDNVDYSANVEDGIAKKVILKGKSELIDDGTIQSVNMPVLTTSNKNGDKTNVLSTNENVVLRSNGDIYDELDLITRQLTQRINENNEVLANPIISTVDLIPSGTLASEKPYMWKNGSIQLSSNGLVPDLEYAVSTSRVGVIETNMQETIQNEKRIHSLEVILAQSTVNSAYDTVSLQSDVEIATMSLDDTESFTENKQDIFLYEMILLLIENNAYNESLFDKVCIFYLYGKLSDEHFVNIYNLLYNTEE